MWKTVFKIFKITFALLVCFTMTISHCLAASPFSVKQDTCDYEENPPVLIITSYNPDTRTMAENLAAFLEHYRLRFAKNLILVETMNCKNLSEAHEWKQRMAGILQKYTLPDKRPALVILLGQEACGAYLAQTSELAQTTPSLFALCSDHTIELPKDSTELTTWIPVCRSIPKDFPHFNIVGGFLYHYDIAANLQLLRSLYPATRRLLFLSDNTFGGVVMQSYVRQEMQHQLLPYERLEWLDGRVLSVTDVTSQLRAQRDSSAVMIGTWRIDCTENYVMGNITHLLYEANPKLPAISVSSVGINDWAIGGYSPVYQVVGDKLAEMAVDFINHKKRTTSDSLTCIPSHYLFNYKALNAYGISEKTLPAGSEVIDRPKTFIQEHLMLVIVVVAIILFLGLCFGIALYYLVRINRMNQKLEVMSKDLIVARDKAEEANRLKSSFLANMSHEIRTPLNAIVGFSGVLVNEDITNEERAQFCDIIRVNSDLLLHLINDILDLSRIESGYMQFVEEKVEVVELCKNALRTSEYARRTEAVYMFESRLTRLQMTTDGQRLQQVLINLLSNASKFTQKGFITLRLEADKAEGMVHFIVEDTGCGIPPEKAEKIFERFEKLNEYVQGTGLGLSISRVIVERLRGKIWVDTTYDKGARFIVALPLTEDAVVEE
jgi:signal transduction histidine kinase